MTELSPIRCNAVAERTWDVVVIGAGPAGAVAARQAAAAGLQTLLVDRKTFPRDKVCGCCVSAQAVQLLHRIGLGEVVDHLPSVSLARFQLHTGSATLCVPLGGGLSILRAWFDDCLMQAAVASGAVFLPGTTAEVQDDDHDQWRSVALRRSGQADLKVRARTILAADGLAGRSRPQTASARSRVAAQARIGLATVVQHRDADYEAGTIFMALGRTGYVGLVRLEDGRLNLAAAVDPAAIRERTIRGTIEQLIEQAGLPKLPALETANWQGTVPLTRSSVALGQRRLFVLGDAAAYVEPFTGEGILWAIQAAIAVTPLVQASAHAWRPELSRHWETRYHTLVGRRQRICRWVAAGLRHPLLVTILLSGMSMWPAAAHPVVKAVGGI